MEYSIVKVMPVVPGLLVVDPSLKSRLAGIGSTIMVLVAFRPPVLVNAMEYVTSVLGTCAVVVQLGGLVQFLARIIWGRLVTVKLADDPAATPAVVVKLG